MARPEVITLCELLRATKELTDIRKLPEMTGSTYHVEIHRPNEVFADESRASYFGGAGRQVDKVVLLDPDIGFEPRNRTEKHVGYSDVEATLDQITDDSVVSVFQYHRHIEFDQDFQDIRQRIISGYSVAIYERDVMFVSISRSLKTIESVIQANRDYAHGKQLGIVADLLRYQDVVNRCEKPVKRNQAAGKPGRLPLVGPKGPSYRSSIC